MCSRPDREGGGYLLSHFRSTIGVAGFNFSVRNGKRWNPPRCHHLSFSLFPVVASLRRPVWWRKRTSWKLIRDSDPIEASECALRPSRGGVACGTFALSTGTCVPERVRAISIARLWTLPPLHLQPIYVIVFDGLCGNLILGRASCLDAFSTYPDQTRIPAVHLAVQPVNRRSVQHGPLVLVSEPRKFPDAHNR